MQITILVPLVVLLATNAHAAPARDMVGGLGGSLGGLPVVGGPVNGVMIPVSGIAGGVPVVSSASGLLLGVNAGPIGVSNVANGPIGNNVLQGGIANSSGNNACTQECMQAKQQCNQNGVVVVGCVLPPICLQLSCNSIG